MRFSTDSGSGVKQSQSQSNFQPIATPLQPIATSLQPNVNSENYRSILSQLREKRGLRPVQPLETGKRIKEAPTGTYFFVSATSFQVGANTGWILDFARTTSDVDWRDYFEMHNSPSGQLSLVAYVNGPTAAELTSSDRKTALVSAVLSPSPWGEFTNLAIIPIARFVSSDSRSIDRPQVRFFRVIDGQLR